MEENGKRKIITQQVIPQPNNNMKRILKLVIAAVIICATPNLASAQKVAHLDLDSLLKIMPDYQAIKDTLTNYSISVQQTMLGMENEFMMKSAEYDSLKKKGVLSPLMMQLREKQLADMQQNYAAFGQAAEQEAAAMQNNMIGPLYKKIEDAVAAVAKEKGYKYVLDSSKGGPVLFSSPEDDIFDAVRVKLKIPVPAPKPAPAPGGGAPAPAPGR
jgi:outer membrane protein